MRPNPRSLIGMLALIGGLTLYALAVMLIAVALPPMPLVVEAVFYLVFGIVWIFPTRRLLAWIAAGQP